MNFFMPVVFMLQFGDLYIERQKFKTMKECVTYATEKQDTIFANAQITYRGQPPGVLVCLDYETLKKMGLKRNEFSEPNEIEKEELLS